MQIKYWLVFAIPLDTGLELKVHKKFQFPSCVQGDYSKFLMWIGVLQWLLTLPTP